MELSIIIPHIEAIIFASEKPVPTMDLVELVNNALGFIDDRATLDQVESAVEAIREKYNSEFYPFEVRESGGGWQFLTKKEYHKTVALINGEKFLKRLSTAALETLAIIAYKQPITKGEIEHIRGVNCDYAVQKLLEKDLVVILGRKEDAPGHPLIYGTSKNFMDYFGINSPDDLPKLSEILSRDIVEPTTVTESNPAEEDAEPQLADIAHNLVVDADGNLEEVPAAEAELQEASEGKEETEREEETGLQEEQATEEDNQDAGTNYEEQQPDAEEQKPGAPDEEQQ